MADNDKPDTLEGAHAEIDALQDKLKSVRAEAAQARVAKRDAVEAAKTEAQQELDKKIEELRKEFEETTVQLNSSKTLVSKLTAALNTVLPEQIGARILDISGRLIGSTDEELKADASRLKTLYGLDSTTEEVRIPPTDPSQGLGNNSNLPLNGDGIERALMNALNSRSPRG